MKVKTKKILLYMNITTMVLFIGVCIKTGALIFSLFVSLFIKTEAAKNLYFGLNLSGLYNFNIWHYAAIVSIIIFLSGLKAYILYLVTNIFLKIKFEHPFNSYVSLLISKISYVALGTGLLTWALNSYCEWLIKSGVAFPDLQGYLGGGSEFVLVGGVIFIIAQVFKRGIEIQFENEFTV